MSVGNTRAKLSNTGELRAIDRRSATRPLRELTDHELDSLVQIARSTLVREPIASGLKTVGVLAFRELAARDEEKRRRETAR